MMKEASKRQSNRLSFGGRKSPRVGLVLGSGGARGWAHVGVCLRLMEAGLRPHCIVGTSIGSVIGALAATDRLASMIELAHHLDWQRTARLFVEVGMPRAGLLNGRRIQRFLRELVGRGRIEDLHPRFAAVATDLYAEEAVVLDRGDIVSALRASLSIPGLFAPVRLQGRWLVDGGLVNPLPVDVARRLGADVVIASEINLMRSDATTDDGESTGEAPEPPPALSEGIDRVLRFVRRRSARFGEQAAERLESLRSDHQKPNLFDVLLRTTRIGENQITRRQLESHAPEHLIQSPVGHVGTLAFHRGVDVMAAGGRAASDWLARVDSR